MSLPDAVGLALEEWMRMKQGIQQDLLSQPAVAAAPPTSDVVAQPVPVAQSAGDGGATLFEAAAGSSGEAFIGTCPDCGSQLEFAEGCVKCHVCGYSECG
jgi:ribonucleoside-diphosphate reductase alpha chain